MEDDTVTIRARRSWPENAFITSSQAEELRDLYSELPDASAAAAEALGGAGAVVPAGMSLQRFRELDARVVELIERIQAILR